MTPSRLLCTIAVATSVGFGCNNSQREDEVMVFAAASLTEAFSAIARDFERTHPKLRVKLNFAGSQSLRTQLEHGARADVFASANARHMDAVRKAGLVRLSSVFAENEMVVVVPAENPAGIHTLADLPRARRLVLAGPVVPAGIYAEQVITNAGKKFGEGFARRVRASIVSREMHVRQTLQKVVLGEADAAMVYATDAAAAGAKVRIVRIPDDLNVVATYPLALVGERSTRAGRLFVEFVQSSEGRRQLERFGFRPVSASLAAY